MAKQTTALSAGVNRGEAAGQQEFRSVPRHPAAGPDMALGKPRVSVVVPARNESENIVPVLDRLRECVRLPCEVLVVVDDPADTTVPVVGTYECRDPRIRCLVNTYGRGPANAIRFGIDAAIAPVAVRTMADGCDDVAQIDDLTRLVERGVAVAAASRYMAGGKRVGGPVVKGMLSSVAGLGLFNPLSIGAGLLLGRMAYKEDRENRLLRARAEAKTNVRRFVDDVSFVVGKESRDRLKTIQRTLRDHYREIADEVTRSLNESLQAIVTAAHTEEAERDNRIRELERQLNILDQVVDNVDRLTPPVTVGRM